MSLEEALEISLVGQQVKRIADVLTASQKDVFVRLPALQGYWPCGIRSGVGDLIDHSSVGANLTQVGTPTVGYDGNSYSLLGFGTNYFSGVGAGAILGTETFVDATIRGLTVGCWFMVDTVPGAFNYGLISRWGSTIQRSYAIQYTNTGFMRFSASGTGASVISATSGPVTTGVWHFAAGRFTPSAEVAVIVDGAKTVNTTAIPAALFNSSQAFEIGRNSATNNNIFQGKVRDAFICAAALEDDIITAIRDTSMP